MNHYQLWFLPKYKTQALKHTRHNLTEDALKDHALLEPPLHLAHPITYIPLSLISDLLDLKVQWYKPHIYLTSGDIELICTIGDHTAIKNGVPIQLTAAPYLVNDCAYLPLRAIIELMDFA